MVKLTMPPTEQEQQLSSETHAIIKIKNHIGILHEFALEHSESLSLQQV